MIPYITQLYSGNLPYISYFIPHYSSKEWFTKGDERTNLPSERLTATVIGFMLVVGSRSLKHTHTHPATIPGQAGFARNVPSKALPEAHEAAEQEGKARTSE